MNSRWRISLLSRHTWARFEKAKISYSKEFDGDGNDCYGIIQDDFLAKLNIRQGAL